PDGVKRNEYDIFQRYGLLFLNDSGMSQGISGNKSIGGALHFFVSSTLPVSPTVVWTVNAICAGGQTIELWDSTLKQAGPVALACPSPSPTPTSKRKS